MFIISKQSDYYDCIMKQGLDKSIVYHRNEQCQNVAHYSAISKYYIRFREKTINDHIHLPKINQSIHKRNYLTFDTGLLGFCGKQYLVMICGGQDIYFASCAYNRWLDKLKQCQLADYQCSVYVLMHDYLTEKRKEYSYQHHKYIMIDGKEKMILASLSKQNGLSMPNELFIELDCPVFFIYQSHSYQTTLIKNPMLKALDFQSILSPQQCFQEISMYIGNFLNQKDNPEQITDNKVLCAAKGFDVKTSFRKPPSKQIQRIK